MEQPASDLVYLQVNLFFATISLFAENRPANI
jgi:hypothetical protein